MTTLLRSVAAVVLAAAACTLFLALVARPVVNQDQGGSWMLGQEMVAAVVDTAKRAVSGAEAPVLTPEQIVIDHNQHAWAANRSPTYSLFFYIANGVGSLWFLTFAQALFAAAVVYAVWRLAAPDAPLWSYAGLMGALIALTALPFEAGFGNADLFAALAVLLTIVALLYLDRCPRIGAVALLVSLAYLASTHAGTILIALGVAGAGALALWRLGRPLRAVALRLGLIVAACAAGAMADPLYGAIYRANTGGSFDKPPFLMARIVADGPGRAYLRAACADGADYALCAYRHLPLDNNDDILWSNDPARGVYVLQDAAGRERILSEQSRFVVGAFLHDPAGVIGAALHNSWRQLLLFDVDWALENQFVWMDPNFANTFMQTATAEVGGCTSQAACAPRLTPAFVRFVHYAVALISLAAALFLAYARWRRREGAGDDDDALLVTLVGLIVLAIAINAVVCGALSGVYGRYQSRVIWLLPLAALLPAWRLYGAALVARLRG